MSTEICKFSDMDLLKLAAKACGIEQIEYRARDGSTYFRTVGTDWNPLEKNADAFWLMVTLHIDVNHQMGLRNVDAFWSKESGCKRESYGQYPIEATRRAIVRAAAEVGKGMLTQEQFETLFTGCFSYRGAQL